MSSPAGLLPGISGVLEHARTAQDVALNLILPFEDAIYSAAGSYLLVIAVIALLIWAGIRFLKDGAKYALWDFAKLGLIILLLVPVNVSFSNPFLWHDSTQTLTSVANTDQQGTNGQCQGLQMDAQSGEPSAALPSCGTYHVALGALLAIGAINAVEDMLYSVVDYAKTQADSKNTVAGIYSAMSIPPDALAQQPDASRIYRDYINECTPVAVMDQQGSAPLDPRAWYSLGLLGGGGTGLNLLFAAPNTFSTVEGLTLGNVTLNFGVTSLAPVAADATKALEQLSHYEPGAISSSNPTGYVDWLHRQVGPVAAFGWYHIPSQAWWEQSIAYHNEPPPDYLPRPPPALNVTLWGSIANEFQPPDIRFPWKNAVGLAGNPTPPADPDSWYAYDCYDLYEIAQTTFEQYYLALGNNINDAYCYNGCTGAGAADATSAAAVTQFSVMQASLGAAYDAAYKSMDAQPGTVSDFSAVYSASMSWMDNLMKQYFSLPVITATAIGGSAFIVAFLFLISPFILVAALFPNRFSMLGTWLKSLIWAKFTIFLMFLFALIGAYIIYWTQQMEAAAAFGGVAGQWRYGALAFSAQGLVLAGVLVAAPLIAYILIFHVPYGYGRGAHHLHVGPVIAGAYLTKRIINAVNKQAASDSRRLKSEKARDASVEAAQAAKLREIRASMDAANAQRTEIIREQLAKQGGVHRETTEVMPDGSTRKKSFTKINPERPVAGTAPVSPERQPGADQPQPEAPVATAKAPPSSAPSQPAPPDLSHAPEDRSRYGGPLSGLKDSSGTNYQDTADSFKKKPPPRGQ